MPEYQKNWVLLAVLIALVCLGCRSNKQVVLPQTEPVASPGVVQNAEPEQSPEPGVKPEQPSENDKKPAPKLGLTQKFITLNWIDGGVVRMKAKAKEFTGDEVTQQGVFTDFSAQLFEDGKQTATLQAPKAVVDGTKRTVIASGGVKMKSQDRASSLDAENVTWYANQKKVVGTGSVKVESTTGEITAAEVVTDTQLRNITVRGSK